MQFQTMFIVVLLLLLSISGTGVELVVGDDLVHHVGDSVGHYVGSVVGSLVGSPVGRLDESVVILLVQLEDLVDNLIDCCCVLRRIALWLSNGCD